MLLRFCNRLIFILSLLGLTVSAFLFYEYSLSGPMNCPVGNGCDIVRASPYSKFLGISLPILGIIFYAFMAGLSIWRTKNIQDTRFTGLQLLSALAGFAFGVYLTLLEAFVIGAYCFWCVLSFIISGVVLLFAVFSWRKRHEN
ncbi:vitamin K epoxide reductase family protein [Candidatus Daviesbacteria bacterium]|nr:vitamin K epoxide reductase family protein [Candidatus Daviesbacteria bacterium]